METSKNLRFLGHRKSKGFSRETKLMNARVPAVTMSEVENIAKEERTDKSSVVRRLLDRAIKDWKLDRAVNMYLERKVTLERAAEIAAVSIREMVNYLKENELEIGSISAKDLEEDINRMYKRIS